MTHIIFIDGKTPEEIRAARERDETPVEVVFWWNREERAWVVQALNADRGQVGDARYLGNCGADFAHGYALRWAHDLGVEARKD